MMSFKLGLKIGVVVVLVGAAGFLFWQNAELIEKGARQAATILQQKAELQDSEQRIEDLEAMRQASERIAAQEKARAVQIRMDVRELQDEMEKWKKENEAIRDWFAGDDMPDELYQRLRAFSEDPGSSLSD